MELRQLIEIAGIAAFSISGALAAMEKKLDVFGILIVAFIAALGGGTLRDVLIGDLPVSWMRNLHYGAIIVASTLVAMLFTKAINDLHRILLVFDSLGLGLFTIFGIQKGIHLELHPAVCVLLGTMTACFGGVIRDISMNNIPLIFQKEIYATACIVGGTLYVGLREFGMPEVPLETICIAAIVILRLLAVRYDWRLPTVHGGSGPPP